MAVVTEAPNLFLVVALPFLLLLAAAALAIAIYTGLSLPMRGRTGPTGRPPNAPTRRLTRNRRSKGPDI